MDRFDTAILSALQRDGRITLLGIPPTLVLIQ